MNTVLRFEELQRYFEGGDGRYVMESGSVQAGGILALKGESGSGKSTLLKTLARLLEAQGGTVYLNEQEWLGYSPQEWRTRVHYISQKPVVFPGTVEENFKLPFILKSLQDKILDINKRNFYLDELGLSRKLLTQDARTLSGGEAARMALIRALLIHPQVLLLDEPTAYLDSFSRSRLLTLLKSWVKENEMRAIIWVSHQDDVLDELDNTMVLTLKARGERI